MQYNNVVILTGAGISAESGIRTFRSKDGLWENHRIEDIATKEGFIRNPYLVQEFYNQRRRMLQFDNIQPNLAHKALGRLERELDGKVTIITQNIDNLHERGGSKNVIHMHGELLKASCITSGQVIEHKSDILVDEVCRCCRIPSPIRPHIVWFGETPLRMADIYSALNEVDLFVSIGTSGIVYPAASFVYDAKICGAHTIEINLEKTPIENVFQEKRYGNASTEVDKLVSELLCL
ncbi:NAD-dependent deacetylase [Candidatus Photodesmus blepharus]|uniref:NAD-dependent protein deacylase n=1 Tax=Candidatus Photodesmus blepharonis TaxID=1179155 RepID=A0A084CNG2_9GAMM|nr:Sir2 family NAD+-dependent deacetylase [Candidatus Photodesmus blepharus]KEY91341.1 NAD-dependent deacetylase [Candidatus Photodesmus blepharus]